MEKIKEFWFSESTKKYKIYGLILLLIVLGVSSCSIADYKVNKAYREKQEACEHDWKEIDHYSNNCFEIYCPKCQLQDYVTNAEWNKIQIDMEYNKQTR